MTKPKVGFYGLTGCAGCLLSVIFNEMELLDIISKFDIVSFPFIKGLNSEEPLDICFIEGTVVSKDDLEIVKKLRERSTVIVSLGACACHGNIPSMRNFRDHDTVELKYEKSRPQTDDLKHNGPLHKFIKVEFMLPGCPPDQEEIKRFFKETLIGKKFYNYKDPVCRECKLFENGCLLDDGKICLGPLIAGGCNAVCTNNGLECYGCRGLTEEHNFEEFFKLLEKKGINALNVKKHMDTFIAVEVDEKLKGTKYGDLH